MGGGSAVAAAGARGYCRWCCVDCFSGRCLARCLGLGKISAVAVDAVWTVPWAMSWPMSGGDVLAVAVADAVAVAGLRKTPL